jgi:hypothetical protein
MMSGLGGVDDDSEPPSVRAAASVAVLHHAEGSARDSYLHAMTCGAAGNF